MASHTDVRRLRGDSGSRLICWVRPVCGPAPPERSGLPCISTLIHCGVDRNFAGNSLNVNVLHKR